MKITRHKEVLLKRPNSEELRRRELWLKRCQDWPKWRKEHNKNDIYVFIYLSCELV
jgi:hypothetical protein